MKHYGKSLTVATAFLALPLFVVAQNSQNMNAQNAGQSEAQRMVPANADLLQNLNSKDLHDGSTFKVKLSQTVKLDDGTRLPSGTMLLGQVATDDMQTQGASKLAIRLTQAQLKNGKVIPIKATIVGVAAPATTDSEGYPEIPGHEVPNTWNDGTLQVDQLNAVKGFDLHSSISSGNSGVFVSKTKDNVKLNRGTEFELALAQHTETAKNAANAAN